MHVFDIINKLIALYGLEIFGTNPYAHLLGMWWEGPNNYALGYDVL
jgi:hypothetical protein